MVVKKINIFEVPAVTKKTVPLKKIPVAVPPEEAPSLKGTWPPNGLPLASFKNKILSEKPNTFVFLE